jgi:nucleoside-diphosphate-sugar epimerase
MASVSGAVAVVKPDVVFHLASLFRAEHKPDEIVPMVAANITLGTQLAEAMIAGGCRALVNTGTAWQHLGNASYDPVCLYAATKQAFEDLLAFYVAARGLSVVTLKIFDTYGPDDPRRKLVPMLVDRLKAGTPMSLTSGEEQLDFCHVDDVVRGFEVAAKRLQSGQVRDHERYALSGGEPCSIRQLVALMETASGAKLMAEWGAYPARERDMRVPWSGGMALPGWSPGIALRDGLKELFA